MADFVDKTNNTSLASYNKRGLVMSISEVSDITGYTPVPIINGIPYYKETDISGSIVPSVTNKYSLGLGNRFFNSVYATYYYIAGLKADTSNTIDNMFGRTILTLDNCLNGGAGLYTIRSNNGLYYNYNNKMSWLSIGTDDLNSAIKMYGNSTGYTKIINDTESTNVNTISLPDKSGTMALDVDIPSVEGMLTENNFADFIKDESITINSSDLITSILSGGLLTSTCESGYIKIGYVEDSSEPTITAYDNNFVYNFIMNSKGITFRYNASNLIRIDPTNTAILIGNIYYCNGYVLYNNTRYKIKFPTVSEESVFLTDTTLADYLPDTTIDTSNFATTDHTHTEYVSKSTTLDTGYDQYVNKLEIAKDDYTYINMECNLAAGDSVSGIEIGLDARAQTPSINLNDYTANTNTVINADYILLNGTRIYNNKMNGIGTNYYDLSLPTISNDSVLLTDTTISDYLPDTSKMIQIPDIALSNTIPFGTFTNLELYNHGSTGCVFSLKPDVTYNTFYSTSLLSLRYGEPVEGIPTKVYNGLLIKRCGTNNYTNYGFNSIVVIEDFSELKDYNAYYLYLPSKTGTIALESSSDIRLKDNIVDSNANGISFINSLPIREFTWNDKSNHPNTKWDVGIIADEIESIDDKLVFEDASDNKYKCIDTYYLQMWQLKAQQETNEIISMQQTIIDDLSSRLELLESLVKSLSN